MMDAFFPFREGHHDAVTFLNAIANAGLPCHIPSHAYFEHAVACIIHFKREPEKLDGEVVRDWLPRLQLNVVTLDSAYVGHLIDTLCEAALPDLKSADLIYFCIARDRGLTLVTQDRKLRNTARKGGIRAFHANEALAGLGLVAA